MNILQIGVNDAVDVFFDFVKQNKSKIQKSIFVDASIEALDKAIERYKTIGITEHFYNYLVTEDNSEYRSFYIPADEKTSGHSSIYPEFLLGSHHNNGMIERQVKCININDLIANFDHIDYFQLDAEGMDADIICAIDFKVPIGRIEFESVHSDGMFTRGNKYKKAIEYLYSKDYKVYNRDLNTIAIHNSIT